jgi:hypothetical protein
VTFVVAAEAVVGTGLAGGGQLRNKESARTALKAKMFASEKVTPLAGQAE